MLDHRHFFQIFIKFLDLSKIVNSFYEYNNVKRKVEFLNSVKAQLLLHLLIPL